MKAYIVRRLLLIVPTLLGISIACFLLIQFVPGGPVEQMISKVQGAASARGGGSTVSAAEIANIKAYFGFDRPIHERYFIWLGKIVRFDLGMSYAYQEPVWGLMLKKLPISLCFGLTSIVLSYLVCLPLGVAKAMRNGSWFDSVTSVVIFSGYVMPGYALGILLIIFLGGGSYLDLFPISGIVSDDYEDLTALGKVLDIAHHMALPLFCYMMSEFAFLTMMLKNSLLDEIGKDYMRTAVVKGAAFGRAVWTHAFRNALVPLATRAGYIFTSMIGGSILIERVFDIDGMGLLVFNSMVNRDYNVVMGAILITSLFAILGRLFSDILYVLVDPRIRID